MRFAMKSLSLVLLSMALLMGCARNARPDTTSAAEHETQAAKSERAAETHEGYIKAAGPYRVRYTPSHQASAEAARKHAEMHRAAAEALRNTELKACVGTEADSRTQCPMIYIDKAEDTADGVVLWLNGDADAAKVSQLMSCHIAHAQAEGYKGMDGCPFYVPGVSASPVEGKQAIRLTVVDPNAVSALQAQVRQMAD